ncbi:helix-turn-helix domain-containing protein [Dyadobacter aurulentus]|uniref:helix-turn-helix domain-containing protein n=1 Tax=Dyadobacter sp. UC 10 TaxID=2605428 RepID=UPI0011F15EA9|nr:helix-turn-helix transcriptional regulator [Dyadobacter sp. UC 10]KAA0989699.1 helix-turn-helix transcriptional regulator [Dyadobacter sp. UC 10]
MAKKQQSAVTSAFDAREIVRRGELTSELDMQRAVWAERSLRLLSKEQPDLEPLRKQVRDLIISYESLHWSDFDSIPKSQFKESDKAERQVKKEFVFFKRRKELIIAKLKNYGLNQNDLAVLLAHSKSYISELLSGTRSFAMNDLIIIHKLFDIKLDELINIEIPAEVEIRFKDVIQKAAKRERDSSQTIPAAELQTDAAKPGKPYSDSKAYRKHI